MADLERVAAEGFTLTELGEGRPCRGRQALGEPELGALLVCATDFDIVAAGGSEVCLTRDQTLMQGAPSCTFRYAFAPRS